MNLADPPGSGPKTWFRIENKSDDVATIRIDHEIGGWGVTAADFVRELHGLSVGTINVHINSPGGDVFDGVAIHNALTSYPAVVNTYVDGLAASAASFIAQAGKTRTMGRYATMMIHNPSGGVWGGSTEMRKMADLLDKLRDTICRLYADRSGSSDTDWNALMDAETWMTAEEAVEFGLADKVDTEADEPEARWDLGRVYQYNGRVEAPKPTRLVIANKLPEPTPLDKPSGETQDAPESAPVQIDGDLVARALRFAIDPPPLTIDDQDAAFKRAWNPEIMHAALQIGIEGAVFNPPKPEEPEPVTFATSYDPELFRRAVLEGMTK